MTTSFPYIPPLRALQPYTHDELANVLNRQIYPWSFILIAPVNHLNSDDISGRPNWQRDFSALKTFTVRVLLASRYMLDLPPSTPGTGLRRGLSTPAAIPLACTCRSQNDWIEALAGGTTNIEASKVVVTVTVEDCGSGACEARLVRTLQTILSGDRMDLGV